MSWRQVLRYASAALGGKRSNVKLADVGLPLGARVGSLLTLQSAPFLRSAAAGTLVKAPPTLTTKIVAISRVKVPMSGRLYRYYTDVGRDVEPQESFLQVYVDERGDVRDVWYYQQLTRMYPTTSAEQIAFTGEQGHGLGEITLKVSRDQLEGIRLPAALLDSAFGEASELVYEREGGDADSAFVRPYRGTETRIDTAEGDRGLRQALHFMTYSRGLADGSREYLLIASEVVESVDGDAGKRSVHVDFMLGISLEKERLTLQ